MGRPAFFDKLIDMGKVEAYSGYEWDTMVMFYDPQSRIYRWLQASGCSCNWIEEDLEALESPDEMNFGRLNEACNAIDAYVRDSTSSTYSDVDPVTMRNEADAMKRAMRNCRSKAEQSFIDAGHKVTLSEGAL